MTVEQRLVLRLFAEKFNQRQFLLLLDGFDEIAPHYKTFVMQYFLAQNSCAPETEQLRLRQEARSVVKFELVQLKRKA